MSAAPDAARAPLRRSTVGCARAMWRIVGADDYVMLAEIAAAGYAGAPWVVGDTDVGLAPASAAREIAKSFAEHGLVAAPGYLWVDFWLSDEIDLIAWAAAVSRELGLDTLLVSAGGFDARMPSGRLRREVPGRVGPEDGLKPDERARFLRNLHAAGCLAAKEGVRLAYHPHVGTVIESPSEVDWLIANTDPDLVFLGPDTGHLRWAGLDVEAFFERHAARITAWHAKDLDLSIVRRCHENGWEYDHAVAQGLFTEIGSGDIDFVRIVSALETAGFEGWVIAETDQTMLATPALSAARCRTALREIGL